jgi:hypothetical protein
VILNKSGRGEAQGGENPPFLFGPALLAGPARNGENPDRSQAPIFSALIRDKFLL